ncbi:hypothetical protein C2845_PM02G13790 [Panicum miliaceum]|uniref:Uncharacterized protein n=1 Tax=Panicum miliaceum TaxID=4540 RepID=A0A3L6SBJ0_PANMI|nr:hypothetical protein C2845_PM02G13790 [Panicum miliaceum]
MSPTPRLLAPRPSTHFSLVLSLPLLSCRPLSPLQIRRLARREHSRRGPVPAAGGVARTRPPARRSASGRARWRHDDEHRPRGDGWRGARLYGAARPTRGPKPWACAAGLTSLNSTGNCGDGVVDDDPTQRREEWRAAATNRLRSPRPRRPMHPCNFASAGPQPLRPLSATALWRFFAQSAARHPAASKCCCEGLRPRL